MKNFFNILVMLLMLCVFSFADEFDEALEAEDTGEYTKAVQLYEKACDKGNIKACFNAGTMYDFGDDIRKNLTKASTLYKKACDKNHNDACYNLALIHEDNGDYAQAIKLYKKLCDSEDTDACYNLALIYEEGSGVKKDYAKATKFYKIACDKEDTDACFKLALIYEEGNGVKKDYAQAAKLYKTACDRAGNSDLWFESKKDLNEDKDMGACVNLGLLYEYGGNGIKQDYAYAAKLYKKACDNYYMTGCYNLAILHEDGNGVKKDINRALELYKESCDTGTNLGCKNYESLK